MNTIVGVLNQV
jgi:hypothetical protein